MTGKELYERFLVWERGAGSDAYRRVSEFFDREYEEYKTNCPEGKSPDQSFRKIKGSALEAIILHLLQEGLAGIGLEIVSGDKIDKVNNSGDPVLLSLRSNILVHYGEYGSHVPDIDLVVYRRSDLKILAVISSKNSVRERVAQTAYWKLKLMENPTTKFIKVVFCTPDQDGALILRENRQKKGRAIVETDTDGAYLITDLAFEESDKLKDFSKLFEDLKRYAEDL